MSESLNNVLKLRNGVPTARYRPAPQVELPEGLDELPLIDEKSPDGAKVQEYWVAHVDVFTDLSDAEQQRRYTEVWQKITDGQGIPSNTGMIERFDERTGKFVALLRWSELRYKLPSDKG